MSSLHTLNKPLSRSPVLHSCLRLLRGADALLLIEDGVYMARATEANRTLWQGLPEDVKLYVLAPDLEARGIGELVEGIEAVSDAGFVRLTAEHDKTVSWF